MKLHKIFSTLLLCGVILAGCVNEEIPVNTGNGTPASIHLKLGGSAKAGAASRADGSLATDSETQVKSLLAVIFDTHKGFYETVEATPAGGEGEYDILIKDDATYTIFFVANADNNLRDQLENLPDTLQSKNASEYFKNLVFDKAPDADDFVMYSSGISRVTTTLNKTENLGEVTMVRRSARFDIVNNAKNVTINKVTFNNRAVKSTIDKGNYMPNTENLFDSKEYSVNIQPEDEYRAQIYSYRNFSMSEDSIPSFILQYTENVDGKDVKREHTVKFIDQNSPGNTPRAIAHNTLYTITLTKTYKLEVTVTVDDWNEVESFNATDLPIDLNEEDQEALNRRLLVYDLFADNIVKTLTADKVATFYDKIYKSTNYGENNYFSISDLVSKKLIGAGSNNTYITDDKGNSYRLPTYGELLLLAPFDIKGNYKYFNIPQPQLYTTPQNTNTTGFSFTTEPFTETVYMLNDEQGYPVEPSDIASVEAKVAFTGQSDLWKGANQRLVYHFGDSLYIPEAVEGAKSFGSFSKCYGVRFRNTSQCSAYCWDVEQDENDPAIFYETIKIKALPEKTDWTAYDIADNVSFWRNGYIEIKIPLTGYWTGGKAKSQVSVSLPSSSLSKYIESNQIGKVVSYFRHTYYQTGVSKISIASSSKFPLLLVKVKPDETTK